MILSYEENAKAAAFELSADERSLLAARSLATSIRYGVGGAIDAIIISMSSLGVLSVTAFKYIYLSVIPTLCVMSRGLIQSTTREKQNNAKVDIMYSIKFFIQNSLRIISFSIIHIWIFTGSSLLFYEKYANFVNMSIRGKGGLIFLFAIISTSIQCIILQIFNRTSRAMVPSTDATITQTLMSRVNPKVNIMSKMLWMFFKDFIFFFLVFILEFLIIWLNLGRFISGTQLQLTHVWLPLAFLPFLVVIHLIFLEHTISPTNNTDELELEEANSYASFDHMNSVNNIQKEDTDSNSSEYANFNSSIPEDTGVAIHEKTRAVIAWLDDEFKFHTSLLDTSKEPKKKPIVNDSSTTYIFDRYTFVWNLRNLDIFFQTLAVSFMVALFLNSAPNFQLLRPVIFYLFQKWVVKIGMMKVLSAIVVIAMIVPLSCLFLLYHFWNQ